MKVLITNHSLRGYGGSEGFVAEISLELRRRGHEVCAFSVEGGPLSEHLTAQGITVVTHPGDCPFPPDIIHGQHHLETITALCAWPGVPAIYLAHGSAPWEEQPPRHPRILHYLGTSPRFGWWIAEKCSIPAESVGVIPNFFDPRRFVTIRPPIHRPGRALVFHNAIEPDGELFSAITEACRAENWSVEGIGTAFGRFVSSPEATLPEYDLVFAGGRSAIEAMASGCAVVPVTTTTLGALIRPENFGAAAELNFCAELANAGPSVDSIREILRSVDAGETAQVTRRIREEATVDATVTRLLAAYEAACLRYSQTPVPPHSSEWSDLATYLVDLNHTIKEIDRRRAELVAQKKSVRAEKDRADERAEKWKQRAEKTAAHLDRIGQKMEGGPWWLARLWRKWRREWDE